MPAIGIFASFEGGNDNTLTPLNSLLQNRINIDFLKLTFSTIMEDKDYDKKDYIYSTRRLPFT